MTDKNIIMRDSPEAAQIQTVTGWVSSTGRFWGADEHMARFADLVAAAEREACALVCDGFDTGRRLTSDFKAAEIAAAIRARGHQTGAVS